MPAPKKREEGNVFAGAFSDREEARGKRDQRYAREVQRRLHKEGPGAVTGGQLPKKEPPKPTNRMSMEDLEQELERKRARRHQRREKKRQRKKPGQYGEVVTP